MVPPPRVPPPHQDEEDSADDDGQPTLGGEGDEAPVLDLSRPDVTTKYRAASDITNAALEAVVKACVEGAALADLCCMGDALIEEKTAGIYNKKVDGEKLKKGVAFPTSISVNEVCGHFRPHKGDGPTLKRGDICKVDLGCHIDGFVTVGAHTVVVPGADGSFDDTGGKTITGRKADVLLAAWAAAEAALRLVRDGKTNTDVTEVMNLAAEQFRCTTLRGVLSHQMKQHVIDCSKVIISRESAEEKVDEIEFSQNEVYAIDVFVSTGDGKPKEADAKTTIYKRDPEQTYQLKTQLGRKFVREVNQRFPTLPFTVCAFEDEKMARVGIAECTRHALVNAYPVLTEKTGEFVAQFKFTVLLLPGGTKKVTGLPFSQQSLVKSSHSVTDETLAKLLASPVAPAAKKKKTKDKATDKPAEAERPVMLTAATACQGESE